MISLNIFILHRLRNKFLQLIRISLDSASRELHQYSLRMCVCVGGGGGGGGKEATNSSKLTLAPGNRTQRHLERNKVNCTVKYDFFSKPLSDDKILDRSKLKQIADAILKSI